MWCAIGLHEVPGIDRKNFRRGANDAILMPWRALRHPGNATGRGNPAERGDQDLGLALAAVEMSAPNHKGLLLILGSFQAQFGHVLKHVSHSVPVNVCA